jgi:insertion element IS1 protein InsB
VPEEEECVLELDELWSLVESKEQPLWHWIAFSRSTGQVVAYAIGDRSEATCRLLWERLPERYRGAKSYSDFWKAYAALFPEEQHRSVGKESGETHHVERWNCTLRQRLGRFVRKTLSFSKSLEMHEGCFRLFLHTHNLSRRAA